MSALLLLLIGLVSPWVVHLAPPRQRPLALLAVLAVFLLFAILVRNPIVAWQTWVGLAAGVASILAFGAFVSGGGGRRPPGGRARSRRRGEHEDVTGEI